MAVLLLAGCGKKEAVEGPGGAPVAIPAGEAAAVRAVLAPEEIHVGDIVSLTCYVLHREGTQVVFPNLADGKNVIVWQNPVYQTVPRGEEGLVLDAQTTLITSLVISNHIIGEGKSLVLLDAEGNRTEIPFPFASLSVVSILQGEDDRELRPADTTLLGWPKSRSYTLVMLLLGALALVVLFAIGARVFRRVAAPPPPPPPVPPHEAARQALAALKAKGWMESGAFEPFYTELSRIVRRYMEGRFQLRAPERTTEEFIRDAANASVLSVEHRRLVVDFLTQSDLVKFARHQPEAADMQHALDAAERLVVETTPAPEPASPQPEG